MKTSLFSIVLMVAFGSVVIGQSLESGEEAALSDAPALPMAEPQLQKGAEQTVSGRWTAAGSPYLIEENLIVAAGDSLIIEPGVTIRFSGLHQVKIQGVLLADGTEEAGIVFTSARSEPASGDWWGILFDGPKARGRLRYVTLRFMSIGVDAKKSGPVTVTQCEISDAKFAGIRWAQTAQGGALRDSRIFRSHVGVMCKAGASPALVGNIVMDNAYVGILCEEGASPSIEGNTLVRNRTSGIACFAGSDPTISKTLIVRNGNGVSCTASSPRIVGCAIYDNEFSGVLCFQQAAPSISGSNIFKNGLSGVRNVSDQNVSTEEVWWGEDVADPGVCIYDGEDRSGYGKVLATDWRSAPNPEDPGQPAVESLTLRADKEGAETIGEELIIENPIWVTLTGADGGPYTVDYTSVTFRLGQEGSARTLVLYETSENSGLFQRRIIPSEVREDRVRFMAAYGDVLSFASDLDPTMRVATRITRRTAEITHLAIEGIDRTTKAPLFVWEYSDPEGDPQAQFEIEVGEEAGGAGAKMWASGPVASSDSEMEYGGRELEEGKTYFVRVRAHDGFSWGPWAEIPFHINTAPSAPNLLAPPDGSTIDRLPPRLIVGGSVDPDGDALAYHFELYYTAEMDSAKMAGSSPEPVPAEGAETLWPDLPRLLENTQYWWRARATDGDLFGPWSEASTFLINTEEEEINPFSLRSPKDGAVVELFRPLFQWERTYDPDPLQEITYAVFYSADSTFAKTKVIKGLKKEIGEMLPRSDLAEDTIYYWMVAAVLDENTLKWAREGTWRFFVNTVNDPPEIRPIPEISFAEDTEFTALDLDAFVSDPDHPRETLTWTCSSDANLSAAVGKGHGITLTPEPNYHGGPVSFVVTATDPEGAAGQVSFSATVLSVNDPPVASAIEDREIEEDTATRIDLIGYAQDLDHALNSLSWTSLQGPEVEVTIQGSVAKIQPVENWNGTTAIAFSMTDPEGGKDETTMNLTVTSVNDAPVIGVLPPVSFAEDGSFVLSLDDYVSDVDHP
ncbi:MAG: right-handed parallel beta-helix repeat-containing protein, partial [Candidatus Latescibacteria bacterium]|nr:right-handed parallel beta-helix repeat-containing protein [Candidatus Latescibacterota bacterium]